MAPPVIRRPIPGTERDAQDMNRMQKTQELNVSSPGHDAEDRTES